MQLCVCVAHPRDNGTGPFKVLYEWETQAFLKCTWQCTRFVWSGLQVGDITVEDRKCKLTDRPKVSPLPTGSLSSTCPSTSWALPDTPTTVDSGSDGNRVTSLTIRNVWGTTPAHGCHGLALEYHQ